MIFQKPKPKLKHSQTQSPSSLTPKPNRRRASPSPITSCDGPATPFATVRQPNRREPFATASATHSRRSEHIFVADKPTVADIKPLHIPATIHLLTFRIPTFRIRFRGSFLANKLFYFIFYFFILSV